MPIARLEINDWPGTVHPNWVTPECPTGIQNNGLIDLNRSVSALACRQQLRCLMSVCSFCSPDYAASPPGREAVQFVCV